MRIGNTPKEENDDFEGTCINVHAPSHSYRDHETNIFPDKIYNIRLNLYGKEHEVSLKDVLLLEEGIKFELSMLSDRTSEQMDKTLERIDSYRLTIITAIEQIQEDLYEIKDEVDSSYAHLRNKAENRILVKRRTECEHGLRTKSSIQPSSADIDTHIENYLIEDEDFASYKIMRKSLNMLTAEKEKLERIDFILNSRCKSLISMLERRTKRK